MSLRCSQKKAEKENPRGFESRQRTQGIDSGVSFHTTVICNIPWESLFTMRLETEIALEVSALDWPSNS